MAPPNPGRVVILVGDTSSCPILHFYQVSSKYCEGYSSCRADAKSNSNTRREISEKVRKPELSFLYPTRHLALFYISTKYHQNIPKGIRVTERTQKQIQTRRGVTTKVRKPKLSFLYMKHCLSSIIKIFQRVSDLQSGH